MAHPNSKKKEETNLFCLMICNDAVYISACNPHRMEVKIHLICGIYMAVYTAHELIYHFLLLSNVAQLQLKILWDFHSLFATSVGYLDNASVPTCCREPVTEKPFFKLFFFFIKTQSLD